MQPILITPSRIKAVNTTLITHYISDGKDHPMTMSACLTGTCVAIGEQGILMSRDGVTIQVDWESIDSMVISD